MNNNKTEKPRTAFILAGGLGTRLRPLTYEIPKLLIPLQGKPILEHVIDLFKRHGANEIILAVGYKAEKFKEHFGDGSKLGVNINYIIEETPLGTAGALKLAKHFLKDTFYMCNGDELKDIDLEEMYEMHKQNRALGTIALTEVDDVSQYGVVDLDENKIKKFVEKPKKEEAPSNLISSGLYILEPEVIELIPEGRAVSIEREIWPLLAEKNKLVGFHFKGQWFPTDNWERYEKALNEWKGIRRII
ncbi:MAG: nucleotidyltransferase family protein [Nanoarchaeota archaeon]